MILQKGDAGSLNDEVNQTQNSLAFGEEFVQFPTQLVAKLFLRKEKGCKRLWPQKLKDEGNGTGIGHWHTFQAAKPAGKGKLCD